MSDPAERARRRLLLSTVPAAAVVPLIFLFPWFGWFGLPGRTLFEDVNVTVVLLMVSAGGSVVFGLLSLWRSVLGDEAHGLPDTCLIWSIVGLGFMLYLAYEHTRFPYYQTPMITYYGALLDQALVVALCVSARRALLPRPPVTRASVVPGPRRPAEWATYAATERGLGELVAWRTEKGTPGSVVLFVVTLAFIPLGLWIGRFGWNAMGNFEIRLGDFVFIPKIVGAILLAPAIFCLVIPVFALVNVLRGPEADYVFSGGLVRARMTEADVIAWADVAWVLAWPTKPSELATYAVVARNGQRIPFKVSPKESGEAFGNKILGMAQSLGVPIRPAGAGDKKPL